LCFRQFSNSGGVSVNCVASYNGAAWTQRPTNASVTTFYTVNSLLFSSGVLFVGGTDVFDKFFLFLIINKP
jgi:hypothetical protein